VRLPFLRGNLQIEKLFKKEIEIIKISCSSCPAPSALNMLRGDLSINLTFKDHTKFALRLFLDPQTIGQGLSVNEDRARDGRT
jgi:hypothetical protein